MGNVQREETRSGSSFLEEKVDLKGVVETAERSMALDGVV